MVNDLCVSMDLTPDRIVELIDRAVSTWEEVSMSTLQKAAFKAIDADTGATPD